MHQNNEHSLADFNRIINQKNDEIINLNNNGLFVENQRNILQNDFDRTVQNMINEQQIYRTENEDLKQRIRNLTITIQRTNLTNQTNQNTNTPDRFVGYHRSSGSANNSPIFEGPRGGHYYLNRNGNKSYVQNYTQAVY